VAIYAAEAIGKLPLDRLDDAAIKEGLTSLIATCGQGGDPAISAAEAIGKLPLDRLDDAGIKEGLTSLIATCGQGGDAARYAAEAIGKLPLDRLDDAAIKEGLTSLIATCGQGGNAAIYAAEAIYNMTLKLSLNKLDLLKDHLTNEQLPELADNIEKNIIENISKIQGNFANIKSIIEFSKLVPTDKKWQDLVNKISSIVQEEARKTEEEFYEAIVKELTINKNNISDSKIGKKFLEQIYEKILEDNKIEANEYELIIALIKSGLTTSISSKYDVQTKETIDEIIFNGKKHAITDPASKEYLGKIAKAIINAETQNESARNSGFVEEMEYKTEFADSSPGFPEEAEHKTESAESAPNYNLALQYRDHTPIFDNSGKFLQKASSDIKDTEVYSVFDHTRSLTSTALLTKFQTPAGETYYYLEERDVYGKHQIAKYSADGQEIKDSHVLETVMSLHCNSDAPEVSKNTQAKLATIFGKYDKSAHAKPNFLTFLKVNNQELEAEQVEDIIMHFAENPDTSPIQRLFHQTLVGRMHEGDTAKHEYVLTLNGSLEKADIKEKYQFLENESPDSFLYVKSFSFMLSAYIDTYSKDIGLYSIDESDLIPGLFSSILGAIPFIGGTVEKVVSLVNQVAAIKDAQEREATIKAFKNMAAQSFDTPEDMSLFCGQVAFALLQHKKAEFENIDSSVGKIQQIKDKIEEAKEYLIAGFLSVNSGAGDPHQKAISKLAMDDVESFVKLLCKIPNKKVNDKVVELVETFVATEFAAPAEQNNASTVINNTETVLRGLEIADNTAETIEKVKCCIVLFVKDFKYDNELLNHPELMQSAAQHVGFSRAVDLSALLSSDLVSDAIDSQDPDIILAGMISLDGLEA
jgi:hypothetical protein